MAATLAVVKRFQARQGQPRRALFDVTLDASYPAGGYAITATQFGFKGIWMVNPNPVVAGYAFQWDVTNGKLKAYWTGAAVSAVLAEVTATTNLSTVVVRVEAVGY